MRSRNYCCRGKAISITHFCACGCMGAWVCHTVLSFPAPLAQPRFSTLSHKRHDFQENITEHEMCVLIFCTTFIWNISLLRRIQRDSVINVKTSPRKVPVFLSDFNGTWIFSPDFRKKLKYRISSKSVQWEYSCSKRTDGHDENVTLRNFGKEPTKLKTHVKLIFN